jgi:hypothetical protein
MLIDPIAQLRDQDDSAIETGRDALGLKELVPGCDPVVE